MGVYSTVFNKGPPEMMHGVLIVSNPTCRVWQVPLLEYFCGRSPWCTAVITITLCRHSFQINGKDAWSGGLSCSV